MDFSVALESLKHGVPMFRKGWNGKNQFVVFISEDLPPEILPFFAMVLMDKGQLQFGWLASQGDLLANDWAEFTGEAFNKVDFDRMFRGLRLAGTSIHPR